MLRRVLLAASASPRLRQLVTAAPAARAIVDSYVAGETAQDAVRVTRELRAAGLLVTLDYLGEDTTDQAQAAAVTEEYLQLIGKLGAEGLSHRGAAEVSVKPTAVGLFLGADIAAANIGRICAAAAQAGTTVTLDAEEFAAIEPTQQIAAKLRAEHPDLGCVVQACLRRAEDDCRALAAHGVRVRLCKGAYSEPDSVAFASHRDPDHRVAGPAHRAQAGQLRVPDAVRDPPRRAAAAGQHRGANAGVRPLRRRLVRLPGPQAGRTAG